MKIVLGVNCYRTKDVMARLGFKSRNALWKALDKLKGIPKWQPYGLGTAIYFPQVRFDKWLEEKQNGLK